MKMGQGITCILAALTAACASPAHADGALSGLFDNVDVSVGGFVREETSVRTVNFENPSNQGGNSFQNRTVQRQAYLPPALQPILNTGVVPGLGQWGDVPLPYADSVKRSDFVPSTNNNLNYEVLRGELEVGAKFGEHFSITGRVRALYEPSFAFDEFNANSVANEQGGGIQGGDPSLYLGKPDYFDYYVEGHKKPNPLEWSGRNYLVYFPALIAQYTTGGLTVRVGNQQIAWGQALFLRTFDVPDGLDLRRHLITDRALEEFSDKRVPALSIRVTDQLTDTILADGYVEKFQPTMYDNPNTPFNVIPAQFTIHDMYSAEGYDKFNKLSMGIRFKGDYGSWGWQAGFARRYVPDGVFRWTASGVQRDFQGGALSIGQLVNTLYVAKPKIPGCQESALCRQYDSTGELLSHTPFEVAPAGVYSANEWFNYAATTRLSGIGGLNSAINDFPALRGVYQTNTQTYDTTYDELNTDFMVAGGSLRGHLAREYFQENDIMAGVNYVNESENNFLNELIFNLEAQYTPKRTYMAPDLRGSYLKEDEYTISLVVDKWHRFFNEFPGTYIVFEAETKNRSDLVGRNLKGYGGSETQSAPGKGSNATYVVFGFLQPWPNKIYELEFATLYDPDGGILAQPGLRWHPGHGIQVEGFYNYINGHLYGNPNNNLLSTLDFAQDFNLRLTYQF